jgi:hypothetical protein
MLDPVAICNLALGWIGAKRIHSFDDDSAAAELCVANYEPAVRAALEARAWTFATEHRTAEAPQASGVAELPALFQLPMDVVRVLACDSGSGSYTLDWRLIAEKRVLSEPVRVLHYKAVVLVVDPVRFSPGFARVVAARLAADLAGPLTESARLPDQMEVKYLRELAAAATLDGMQGKSVIRGGHTLKGVR